ncbi:MAG TPA: agmatinase [Firmicutes bacterium]|nr:agmatinase [Bacillota bacterium]
MSGTSLLDLCEDSGGRFLAAGHDYATSRLVLVGAPMDYTVSFRPGSRSGPQAVRAASHGLEEYSLAAGKSLFAARFFDAGDLLLPIGDVGGSLEIIEEAVHTILAAGKFPLLLGGEHLVTLGALRATTRHVARPAVVQLDAHADLRSGYLGVSYSHASVMYHVVKELGLELYQYGIRSAAEEEVSFAKEHTHFYPFHVLKPLEETVSALQGRPVYLTIDIDVADPAYAPGTGTPEPGGITSAELLAALKILSRLELVGMDVVEVAPHYDPAGITAMLAAKIVREIILAHTV